MLKKIIGIGLFSLVTQWTMAQGVSYEYWLDDDYQGHIVDSGGSDELSFSIDMSPLQQGIHFLNIRARQENSSWGALCRYAFLVPNLTLPAKQYESWLDCEYDKRIMKPYSDGDILQMVNIDDLSGGIHYYNVRVQDSGGVWGSVSRFVFLKPDKDLAEELKAVEYWIDNDSANSTTIKMNDSDIVLNIDISALSVGEHQFCCRLQNGNGAWGQNYAYGFTVEESSDIGSVLSEEGNKTLRIYLLTGILFRSGKQDEVMKDMPKGIYIVNGKKIIKQ